MHNAFCNLSTTLTDFKERRVSYQMKIGQRINSSHIGGVCAENLGESLITLQKNYEMNSDITQIEYFR